MVKKVKITREVPPEILEDIRSILNNNNIKFEEASPELLEVIATDVIKFHRILEQIMTVSTLPPALYEQYRRSGKTMEEVYREITSNN
jgi:hypothetical protein